MIAPLPKQPTLTASSGRRLHKVHELVAATLLGQNRSTAENAPEVSSLVAWTFALWTTAVTVAYATAMLGWW